MRRYRRRDLLKLSAAVALVASSTACGGRQSRNAMETALAELERQSGGRLGVAITNRRTGESAGHRADERFGLCSTFKLPLVAFILLDVQEGRLRLDGPVRYTADDMVPYAPVAEQHVERGYMTVSELAEAAQTVSDNVAANLLLNLIGGPAGFTARLRAIGDDTTRLDRYEPELNLVPAGETRDTTTPAAMAGTIGRLLDSTLLSAENVARLRGWMENTRTGIDRLRAGFPAGWRAGNKTGTAIAAGMPNKYNDVAAVWSDDGVLELVVAAYYEAEDSYERLRDEDIAVLRRAGEIAAEASSLNRRQL